MLKIVSELGNTVNNKGRAVSVTLSRNASSQVTGMIILSVLSVLFCLGHFHRIDGFTHLEGLI